MHGNEALSYSADASVMPVSFALMVRCQFECAPADPNGFTRPFHPSFPPGAHFTARGWKGNSSAPCTLDMNRWGEDATTLFFVH